MEAVIQRLPATLNNNMPVALHEVCLKAQIWGRAKDLTAGIPNQDLIGDNGVAEWNI